MISGCIPVQKSIEGHLTKSVTNDANCIEDGRNIPDNYQNVIWFPSAQSFPKFGKAEIAGSAWLTSHLGITPHSCASIINAQWNFVCWYFGNPKVKRITWQNNNKPICHRTQQDINTAARTWNHIDFSEATCAVWLIFSLMPAGRRRLLTKHTFHERLQI